MDIKQFLDIVQNADTYKKYLKELEDQEKKIREAIELTGKVSDIEALWKKAKKEVEVAQEEATNTRKSANTAANAVIADAQAKLVEAQATLDRVTSDGLALKAEQKFVREQKAALQAKEKEVDAIYKRIAEYEKSLSQKDQELSAKLLKINSVLG
jgi:cell division septum initiation protein DivIVA